MSYETSYITENIINLNNMHILAHGYKNIYLRYYIEIKVGLHIAYVIPNKWGKRYYNILFLIN